MTDGESMQDDATMTPPEVRLHGILNSEGSNNCFLNTTVQALWNLHSFRDSFPKCAPCRKKRSLGATLRRMQMCPRESRSKGSAPDDSPTAGRLFAALSLRHCDSTSVSSSSLCGSPPPENVAASDGSAKNSVMKGRDSDDGTTNEPQSSLCEASSESSLCTLEKVASRHSSDSSRCSTDHAEAHINGESRCPIGEAVSPKQSRAKEEDLDRCDPDDCCICALRVMFTEFENGPTDAENVANRLRLPLSACYASQNRFQLGDMEDATEAFETLCEILHGTALVSGSRVEEENLISKLALSNKGYDLSFADVVSQAAEHTCEPTCVADSVFGITTVDQTSCTFCGAMEEPACTNAFVYRVYVGDLMSPPEACAKIKSPYIPETSDEAPQQERNAFASALHRLLKHKLSRGCASCCSTDTMETSRWVTKMPQVMALSLCWPERQPMKKQLNSVIGLLHPTLPASCVCLGKNDDTYLLRGMICFEGCHYIAFFWNQPRNSWVVFDDTIVQEIGSFSKLIATITKEKFVPTLLFYEKADANYNEADVESPVNEINSEQTSDDQCNIL